MHNNRERHEELVHVYGEIFALYPCEECGYSGTDVTSFKTHIEQQQGKQRNISVPLEELVISKLPEVSNWRKHDFADLVINEYEEIKADEEVNDNFNLSN